MHLDELEVLAFVEGERRDLREHVDSCPVCAHAVAEQEAARDALRASPLFPPPSIEGIVAALPSRGRSRLTGWPRLTAILAPVAAGAIALAIVTTRGEDVRPTPSPEAATALKAAPAQQDSSGPAVTQPPGVGSITLARDFMIVFKRGEPARKARDALIADGFAVSLEHRNDRWFVSASKGLDEDDVAAAEAEVKRVARLYGGRYAGAQ